LASSRSAQWLTPLLLVGLAATRWSPVAAPAMLIVLAYLPGRAVVSAWRVAAGWDVAGRTVLALAFSLAVVPVVLNPVWHWTHEAWPLLGAALPAVYVPLAWASWTQRRPATPHVETPMFESRPAKVAAAAIAAVVAFATIGTYWPSELFGYPAPSLIHDFIKHHAVLFSMQRSPLPLGNPFYALGADGPVYYYHFFYLIPATVRQVCSGVSIELAFGLQAALVALASTGIMYLIVKRFAGGDGPATLAALLITLVGELDVVPLVLQHKLVVTLDAWSDPVARIDNLLTQMVWTPQNVQGLLVGLVGVYALSLRGASRGWIIMGPLLIASLVGSSVWVALAFLPALVVYVLLDAALRYREDSDRVKHLIAAGLCAVLALVISAPLLAGYVEMSQRHGQSLTLDWPHATHALLGRFLPAGLLANLADLPWFLAVEFGPLLVFPLLAPREAWRRAWRDDGLRLLLIAALVALIGFVTVRSRFTYNDFGQKIIQAAQAAGVVLGACVLSSGRGAVWWRNPLGWRLRGGLAKSRRKWTRAVVIALLLAGLPVGLYQSPLAAVRRYATASGPLAVVSHNVGTMAAREAAADRFLRYELPADAVVQADCQSPQRLRLLQIARRQIGVMVLEQDTMVFMPHDPLEYQKTYEDVRATLANQRDASASRDVLKRAGVTHVFVGVVERETWAALSKFEDTRFFTRVFEKDGCAVYEVR